jgi:universal stress protein A
MPINQHVMIPLDFTDLSMVSVRTAREIAFPRTEITLLYIYDPSDMVYSGTADLTPRQEGLPLDVAERLRRRLRRIRERELEGVETVNTEIVVSRFPAEAICRYARQESVDLIIIATHGRSGLSHLFTGSVAEEVVRKAPCPVLVARPYRRASGEQPAGKEEEDRGASSAG